MSEVTKDAEPHVCLRGIWFPDGSCTIHVIARGSAKDCQAVADVEPPDMDIDRRVIVAESFAVITERRYLEAMLTAKSMFSDEPKGIAGEQSARANPPARLQ